MFGCVKERAWTKQRIRSSGLFKNGTWWRLVSNWIRGWLGSY